MECTLPTFVQRLLHASRANRSLLCVGLDPDPALIPITDVLRFNKSIIDATKDLVCAYKPNLGFYEAMGLNGMRVLEETVSYIRTAAPDAVVIGEIFSKKTNKTPKKVIDICKRRFKRYDEASK